MSVVRFVGISKTKRRKVRASFEGEVESEEQYIIEREEVKELGVVLPEDCETDDEPGWAGIRRATDPDILQAEMNQNQADEALPRAQKMADKRSLPMNIIGSEYSFQKSQLKFYFKAPHRVDFRGLVKALAHEFSTRIELEQVGPREAASILGGCGRCGQELCCRRFLYDPGPVPMELAEKQEISVSPDRITGACGRLACCLKYELEDYEEKLSEMPNRGSEVDSPAGKGKVIERNVQKDTLRVKLEEEEIREFDREEVEPVRE